MLQFTLSVFFISIITPAFSPLWHLLFLHYGTCFFSIMAPAFSPLSYLLFLHYHTCFFGIIAEQLQMTCTMMNPRTNLSAL